MFGNPTNTSHNSGPMGRCGLGRLFRPVRLRCRLNGYGPHEADQRRRRFRVSLACGAQAPIAPSDRVRALAPIEQIDINVAESFPPQYFVGIISLQLNLGE